MKEKEDEDRLWMKGGGIGRATGKRILTLAYTGCQEQKQSKGKNRIFYFTIELIGGEQIIGKNYSDTRVKSKIQFYYSIFNISSKRNGQEELFQVWWLLRSVLIFVMIYLLLVPPVLKHPVYVHVRVIAADRVGWVPW